MAALPEVERKKMPFSYHLSTHPCPSWASCRLDTAQSHVSLAYMLGGGHFRRQGAEQREGQEVGIESEDRPLTDKIILA